MPHKFHLQMQASHIFDWDEFCPFTSYDLFHHLPRSTLPYHQEDDPGFASSIFHGDTSSSIMSAPQHHLFGPAQTAFCPLAIVHCYKYCNPLLLNKQMIIVECNASAIYCMQCNQSLKFVLFLVFSWVFINASRC